MPRKTVDVKHLIETANNMLLHSPDEDRDGRLSIQALVEVLLMDTGNYDGFMYLNAADMGASKNGTASMIDTDGTRIRFCISNRLR